jgi:hypothetical protein
MPGSQTSALLRFFAGLTEHTFQTKLGVADPILTDYLSELLTRFIRNDAIHNIRNTKGRPLFEVVQMLSEAEQRVGSARRDVHRHIGDYTLFWAGLYPESLRKKQAPERADHVIDYCEQGKRAYWIASTIETNRDGEAPSDVLERLASEFEMCAYGLREVRRQWERRDDGDAPRPFLIN